MPPTDCPSSEELAAFDRGDLPPAAIDRVAAHVEGCPACEAALAALESGRGDTAGEAVRRAKPAPPLPPAPAAGAVVAGRYRLTEVLGEGGMGTVWRAEQVEPVRRPVAVKLVKAGMDSAAVLRRFAAERQALALMDHPNIARVFDAGQTEQGRPYFVMELVAGMPITAYCDERRLTPRQRLRLFAQVCQAVQHAHQKGVIHRDLKPGNVLVAEVDGRPVPKVIDFGIAKATGSAAAVATLHTGPGAVVGTPEYMAPEQASPDAADVDTRADIYSLGVLLYELLTGSTPLTRQRLQRAALLEVLRLVREEEPPTPSSRLSTADGLPSIAAVRGTEPRRLTALLRGDLDWIALKCLEKDRGRRYDTAAALARDVERHLADEPVEAGRPTRGYRLRKFARRHRLGLSVAAGFALLLTGAAVVSTAFAVSADRARVAAVRAEGEERAARETAQRRAEQLAQANRLLAEVFWDMNVMNADRGNRPLSAVLCDRLLQAASRLDAVDEPATVAWLRHALGAAVDHLGRPQEAAPLLRAALQTQETTPGVDLVEVSRTRDALASALTHAGRPAEALPLYERAVADRTAALGPADPTTLAARNNLAVCYAAVGRRADCTALHAETLRLLVATGQPGPKVAASRLNLAESYRNEGRAAEAVAFNEETLRLLPGLGVTPDNFLTSVARLNLGAAYADADRPADALAAGSAALADYERRFAPTHQFVAAARIAVAGMELAAGRPTDAARRADPEAVAAALGPDHPYTLSARLVRAAARQALGGSADAAADAETTARLCRDKLGPDHPTTLAAVSALATAYETAGRAADAEPLRRAAVEAARSDPRRPGLDRHRRAVPGGPAAVAAALELLGRNRLRPGRWAEAEADLRESLSQHTPASPADAAVRRGLLGAALAGRGRYAEAEPLLLAAYDTLRQATLAPRYGPDLPAAADRLTALYTAWGRQAEAARWRAERAKYPPEVAPRPRPAE